MLNIEATFTLTIFFLTVLFIVWRPRGINETIPTAFGATILLIYGIVPLQDVLKIIGTVSGPAITILSTIVMSIVLESIGFFKWAAFNIVQKARGSGTVLFFYVILLCFLMTMFFNNDGSILITTPIIIHILNILKLKMHQKLPYLLAGVLIATASSAPIGVSNLANLIALKIVGLDLNSYAAMMFIPSMIGIISMVFLLYFYFRNSIPRKIPTLTEHYSIDSSPYPRVRYIPLSHPLARVKESPSIYMDWKMFKICFIIVVFIRGGFFALAPFGVPMEVIGIFGAILLLIVRWYKKGTGPYDVIKKTPFHILIFAFSMYVLVYGLQNVGLTNYLVEKLQGPVSSHLLNASLIMGILLTVLSNLCNNLPAVMIGTLSLTEMGLNITTLQVAYLANVIGADIGALLTPMGTLATLIWMFIIRKYGIKVTWGQYIKVTIAIVPIPLVISLLSLYFWVNLIQ